MKPPFHYRMAILMLVAACSPVLITTLLNQYYILDPDLTVDKVINEFSKKNNFEIINYNLVSLES